MKIQYHNSLNVAHKVIKSLNKLVESTKFHRNSTVNPQYNYYKPTFLAKEISLGSWSNGREQGLCLKLTIGPPSAWISFNMAENRNSDDIVIIKDVCGSIDNQTNQPSEEAWKNRKYFGYGKYDEAAEYIYQEICTALMSQGYLIRNKESKKAKSKEEVTIMEKKQEIPSIQENDLDAIESLEV